MAYCIVRLYEHMIFNVNMMRAECEEEAGGLAQQIGKSINRHTAVRQLPDKQYGTDPIPTRLLKEHVDVFAPFLTALFNRSLSLGVSHLGLKLYTSRLG